MPRDCMIQPRDPCHLGEAPAWGSQRACSQRHCHTHAKCHIQGQSHTEAKSGGPYNTKETFSPLVSWNTSGSFDCVFIFLSSEGLCIECTGLLTSVWQFNRTLRWDFCLHALVPSAHHHSNSAFSRSQPSVPNPFTSHKITRRAKFKFWKTIAQRIGFSLVCSSFSVKFRKRSPYRYIQNAKA